ncbi:MLO-like protein 4 [Chenopodium quinoa]|uniref:MLO-like protein 4 n=1 Tax=Chenopodium quinoa TaxID=63459 RepID=UPI000B78C639|nr:MLO-like protein 4 [Chenopodium quinoa]
MEEERSLTETPTWAVATVISVMVATVFCFTKSIEFFGRWLDKRKRKPLLAALNKIKEELVVFGVLSLLMGHFSIFVANICVKSSVFSTRFYPCIPETASTQPVVIIKHITNSNDSMYAPPEHRDHAIIHARQYCDESASCFY